ncbi:MAG: 4Fe-4S dicluster domain-containing protein [Bradyrhizobiaceae bacterium]|nr:4Fe-4S dicluster domain-containing protein [Bradyrhizobiaceae bacterium]
MSRPTPASDGPGSKIDRRSALRLMASGVALGLSACGRPAEEIVPYVTVPERLTPGIALRFASTLPLAGFGRGVIVTSVEGRPIKIDGNPRHPASLGATDVFAEAAVLSLYDPDRMKAVTEGNDVNSWDAFEKVLRERLTAERRRGGSGLRLLTNRVTSPTLLAQIDALLKSLPEAKWYRYEPVDDDAARTGAIIAFGRPLTAIPRLAHARIAVALDADPIGPGPEQIRFGHDFANARRSGSASQFLRLYAVEPAWSLTGANADHRIRLSPQRIQGFAVALANELGAPVAAGTLPVDTARIAKIAAADLKSQPGHAVVLAGRSLPPDVHALVHWINARLSAPIDLIEPVDPVHDGHGQSLKALAQDLAAGNVETLIIIGANPAYDSPDPLRLGDLIAAVPFSAHLGLYTDETAMRCRWRLPMSHPLESWSDLRAFEGTASVVQPLIRPLYDSRTAHELLAVLLGEVSPSSHDIVMSHWRARSGSNDFATWWREVLHDGVVADTAARPVAAPSVALPQVLPASPADGFTLTIAPGPSVWDGGFANNAWLQECPQPLTTQVWGNALQVSPQDAARLGVVDGDMVHVRIGSAAVDAPVLVRAGQAENVVAATLGYGRWSAGAIGDRVGFNVCDLRTLDQPWVRSGVEITKTGARQDILLVQKQFELDGEATELQPRLSLVELAAGKRPGNRPDQHLPTLYPPHPYDGHAWAMVIDNAACIGCNACVVACQAENNVPVVGPDQIAVGRDMHWLRVDSYVVQGRPGFSPVPCMHCEHAPCEPVCPVAASIHDGEGLNAQVYNRCIGTRFCQSNCPYKVRRFNFFGYADGQEYANLGAEAVKAVFNPDVSVRTRGVMEKCTYCVQRISRARRDAEKENRQIRDGEVVTACQAACPTRAISFGDRNDPNANINDLRKDPRRYELLGHLGTRPRTTYLAQVRNPNPELGDTLT